MDHALLEAPLAQQSSEAIWKVFLRIGLPVALQMLGSVGASLATTIILARYANEDVLAGFALADVFCNSLGRWITYGLAAAYDTLAAQAWGAKEHRKIGADGVRVSLILLMTVCVPLTPIWWWASPILEAFGQKRSVANQASIFARIYLPGFYMQAIACALSKAFLAMGKARPVLVSSVLNDTTTLGLIVLFVVAPLQLELTGAAMARTVGSALSLLVLVMWAACDADCRQCWPGLATLSGEAWRGWRDYFRLGLPACLMLLAEALSWDVVTFLAGLTHTATGGERYEPTAILAAQGVLQSTITMTYCVPQAICRGASTVIGNAVGAGDEKRATHAARFTLIAGVLTTSLLVGGLTLLRERVVDAYGAPADVSEIVSKMLLCVAGFLFADGLQMCLTGIITGAGKQNITGPILVVAYFLIGLPSGAVLAFAWPVLGLLGAWLGMTLAVYLHFGSYMLVCFAPCSSAIRWDVAVNEARKRLPDLGGIPRIEDTAVAVAVEPLSPVAVMQSLDCGDRTTAGRQTEALPARSPAAALSTSMVAQNDGMREVSRSSTIQ